MNNVDKMIQFVSKCQDPEQLKIIVGNARKQGAVELAEVAFRKLISIVPQETAGTVEHDFWQTIHAFEYALAEERGKTTRLARTRQKVARVGVLKTLEDWALSNKETDGFKMLLERGMPELTGEAIVLRHGNRFSALVVSAARSRLEKAGVDMISLRS